MVDVKRLEEPQMGSGIFFEISLTGFHFLTWLKDIEKVRKLNSPLHLCRAFLPRSGRGPMMSRKWHLQVGQGPQRPKGW